MPDGTPLAIDVHRPASARPSPTILYQTRYFRAMRYAGGFEPDWLVQRVEAQAALRERFVAAGYAWVDVCLRGSGASGGSRAHPWSPAELSDGRALLDWIASRSWSDGRVGALGTSYSGAAAELLAIHAHPALWATSPRFAPFDVFTDILAPGGIRLSWFTARWGAINAALDRDALDEVFALLTRENTLARAQWWLGDDPTWLPRLDALFDRAPVASATRALARAIVRGVRPAHADPEAHARRVQQHAANLDISQSAARVRCRDDVGISPLDPTLSVDALSPHQHIQRVRQSARPSLIFTGWMDGGYCRGNALRAYNLRDQPHVKLIIGPWDHLGQQHVSPRCQATRTGFDHGAALLDFFEDPCKPGPRVRYFVMGQERWRQADAWPPPEATPVRLYLGVGHTLSDSRASRDFGRDRWRQDLRHGSGKASRWRSMIALDAPIHYPDRRAVQALVLSYTSAALPQGMTLAGHPLLHLWVDADREDFDVFAYLEDVAPSGASTYITEGCLRASHRALRPQDSPYDTYLPYRTFKREHVSPFPVGPCQELVLDLLPTAYHLAPGHRLRLSLAGTDADHFSPPPAGAATLHVHRSSAYPSRLELPCL